LNEPFVRKKKAVENPQSKNKNKSNKNNRENEKTK
jgi:hypothetical protein